MAYIIKITILYLSFFYPIFWKVPPETKLENQGEKYFLFVFFISSSQFYAFFFFAVWT